MCEFFPSQTVPILKRFPSASDSAASLSPTLRALQIKFTYLLTYF